MHIYAFGSICRGEIDGYSDVDLLAIDENQHDFLDPNVFSIYSYDRLRELWVEGNPFAWHLSFESKLIFSSDGSDFIKDMDEPQKYRNSKMDCEKFFDLFINATKALEFSKDSRVFEFSNIYLAIRNFATCFALGNLGKKEFSRFSAIRLGESSLGIERDAFLILQKARFLSTRGIGDMMTENEFDLVASKFQMINNWMESLMDINHG